MIIKKKLDLNRMMGLVSDFMIITSSLRSCNINTISDVGGFCFRTGKNTCTPDTIADNVQKNLFVLMAKMTDLSNIVMDGYPKTAPEAEVFGEKLGNDMGAVVRIVLGFHQ